MSIMLTKEKIISGNYRINCRIETKILIEFVTVHHSAKQLILD